MVRIWSAPYWAENEAAVCSFTARGIGRIGLSQPIASRHEPTVALQIVCDHRFVVVRRLIGKPMFDVGFDPWGDPPPFGMPVFVVTHEERDPLPMQGGTTYTFVHGWDRGRTRDGPCRRRRQGRGIWGGANIMRQYLKAGLLDEMQIHLIPRTTRRRCPALRGFRP